MSVLPPPPSTLPLFPNVDGVGLREPPPDGVNLPPPYTSTPAAAGYARRTPPPSTLPLSPNVVTHSLTHSLSITRTWVFLYLHTHVRNKVFWAKAFFWKECIYHETKLCIHHPHGLGHEYVAPPPLMVYSGVFIFTSPC